MNDMRSGMDGVRIYGSCRSKLTREPGRFLPAESCALAVRSLQVSSCTAEHHGLLGFPSLQTDETCLTARKTLNNIFSFNCLLNCCNHLFNSVQEYFIWPLELWLLCKSNQTVFTLCQFTNMAEYEPTGHRQMEPH